MKDRFMTLNSLNRKKKKRKLKRKKLKEIS